METRNETAAKTAPAPSPENMTANLFAMARNAAAESQKQAERWMEYGAAQLAESNRVTRSLYKETEVAMRAFVDGGEALASRSVEAASRLFGQPGSANPFGSFNPFDRSAS